MQQKCPAVISEWQEEKNIDARCSISELCSYLDLHDWNTFRRVAKSFVLPLFVARALCFLSASFCFSGLPAGRCANHKYVNILKSSLRRPRSKYQARFSHIPCFEGWTVLTWPDKNILYWQHGSYREEQVLTAEWGSFQYGPGQAWVQGEFHHQLPKPSHCTSPTANKPDT